MDLFSEFKHLDKFMLSEAGFLLCNHAPLPTWWPKHGIDPHEVIRKKAGMTVEELEGNARCGALKVFDGSGNQIKFRKDRLTDEEYRAEHNDGRLMNLRGCIPHDRWFVMRHDLEEWANARGIKPAFLFPEDRLPIKENDKKESTRLTENLYRTIACLAIDAYGYKPEDSKSAVPGEISKIMCERFDFDLSDKTIRNWIKKGMKTIKTNQHKP